MLPSREAALDILGLPSLATAEDIVLRYKSLSLEWFPEKHNRSDYSIQVFSNITEAALKLLSSNHKHSRKLELVEMYHFFQHIFFGNKHGIAVHDDCEEDSEDCDEDLIEEINKEIEEEEIKADHIASKLVQEEEEEKNKAQRKKAKKKRRKERKKIRKGRQ